MAEGKPTEEARTDESNRNGEPTPLERLEKFAEKIAVTPKEGLDEKRAGREREKKEKRAG